MRLLHTSDWHLGQQLMGKSRKAEHEQFLDWLIDYLTANPIDLLLVAGDIFDTGTPPNYALQLYYNFLRRLPDTRCPQTVIVGGNHDSVATLHAPRELLKTLQVQVSGGVGENPADDLIVVRDRRGEALALVAAVPFLRDRDLRRSEAGESYEEKSRALLAGIKEYYQQMADLALAQRQALPDASRTIPIIASGHLYTAGGQSSDGVREIYLGTLGQVPAAIFPATFDYIALGHLHKPQKVAGGERIRYSGSPLPLSFSETATPKQVLVVECGAGGQPPAIEAVAVPLFQKLHCLQGDLDQISAQLATVAAEASEPLPWLEIVYTGSDYLPDLQNKVRELTNALPVELLAIKNMQSRTASLRAHPQEEERLESLTPMQVFTRRLRAESGLAEEEHAELLQAFNEICNAAKGGF